MAKFLALELTTSKLPHSIMNKRNLFNVLFFILMLISSSAFSINKCTINEKVSYTDLPCPEEAKSTRFTRQVVPSDNPVEAQKRHRSNQKQLRKIAQQKAKEERKYQRERRALASDMKKEEDRKFKCKELDLNRRSARRVQSEIQLEGNNQAAEKARLNVKRAENKFEQYCKS